MRRKLAAVGAVRDAGVDDGDDRPALALRFAAPGMAGLAQQLPGARRVDAARRVQGAGLILGRWREEVPLILDPAALATADARDRWAARTRLRSGSGPPTARPGRRGARAGWRRRRCPARRAPSPARRHPCTGPRPRRRAPPARGRGAPARASGPPGPRSSAPRLHPGSQAATAHAAAQRHRGEAGRGDVGGDGSHQRVEHA